MQAAILSDLHLEFEPFTPPLELRRADLVILAGDIHNGVPALHWARRSFPDQPILQIAGNHEFFGGCWQSLLPEMREAARALDIHFLENDAVVIDGVQFLGATLWTDFELLARPGRPVQLSAADAKVLMQRRMVDYSLIRWRSSKSPGEATAAGSASDPDGAGERVFRPDDSLTLHLSSRHWLEEKLALPFEGLRVVVSHHLPSWRSVAPAFARAASNAAFASDLDAMFGPVALWVHGHTHNSFDYRAGATRVVANPRGYPMKDGAFENPCFDPALLVRIGG
jgi:predicted phosphodiesterase